MGLCHNRYMNKIRAIIATFAVLIVALSVTLCWGIFQANHNTKLRNEAELRERVVKELQQKVDKLENQLLDYSKESNEEPDFSKYDATSIIEPDVNNGLIGDHVRGNTDARVVVVEYADLSCPGCATMMPYMSSIYKKYSDTVAFVFRNYPLKSHKNARPAAAAVESAGIQGYYWEMLEATFANRTDWLNLSGQDLENAFVSIFKKVAPKGNLEKFRQDLSSIKIEKKIDFDYNLGRNNSRVSATPSIFVNGKYIDTSSEDATFDSVANDVTKEIDAELAR